MPLGDCASQLPSSCMLDNDYDDVMHDACQTTKTPLDAAQVPIPQPHDSLIESWRQEDSSNMSQSFSVDLARSANCLPSAAAATADQGYTSSDRSMVPGRTRSSLTTMGHSRTDSSCQLDVHSSIIDETPPCAYCCLCQSICYRSKTTRPTCPPNPCPNGSCFLFSLLCDCRLRRRRIQNENLLVLSIIQLLCGFASMILSGVALTKAVFLYRMGTGLWAGFLMLISGTQGLITARRPIVCTLVGLLTVCVISTLAACILIGVSVAGIIEDGFLTHISGGAHALKSSTVKFTYAFPISGGYAGSSNPYRASSRIFNLSDLRLRAFGGTQGPISFTNPMPDSILRTCQVILHVLLLLVGILESSVSLSICVLCCRFVCSRTGNPAMLDRTRSGRTNLVSFDSETANQAAVLLQSGDVNHFVGSGNFLLAVAAHSMAKHEQHFQQPLGNPILSDSFLQHITTAPFLSESGDQPALILTQAGTGAMAWTAARAAAALLHVPNSGNTYGEFGEFEQTMPHDSIVPYGSQRTSNTILRRMRSRFPASNRRAQRPRLLFTSLNAHTSRPIARTNVTDPLVYNINNSNNPVDNLAPPYPPGSAMLYVVPSPTREEPPMIFPPFPPTYSPLQQRPSGSVYPRAPPDPIRDSRRTESLHAAPRRGSDTRRSSRFVPRLFRHSISHQSMLSRLRHSTRDRPSRPTVRTSGGVGTHNTTSTSASTLICAIDRLLQPVLIVGHAEVSPTRADSVIYPFDPPQYTTYDPMEAQLEIETRMTVD